MSNLKQRIEKLEQGGGIKDVGETVEAWLLDYGPEVREAMRGHEDELVSYARSGRFTWEAFLVIVRHVCPEVMQSAR